MNSALVRWRKFLLFSVVHSWRDMVRNRARTTFALVCVATGVAAVVALRTLAFMVGHELTTNLAELNRGDIRVYASRGVPELIELSAGQPVFTQEAVDLMTEWAAYEGMDLTMARINFVAQIKPEMTGDEAARSGPGLLLFVEGDHYPFYDTIALSAPAETTFSRALQMPDDGPYPIVIASTLTRSTRLGLAVGDMLRLGASETSFVVAGVAAPESESVLTVPQTAFIDYAYLPLAALPLIDEKPLPDQVFIKAPLGRDIDNVELSLITYLQGSFETETDFSEELNRQSVSELAEQNSETADIIDDMILVMGLSSLLIGGIGIINTMLVVVSRRTLEIAVLKTLGLKAYRVTGLFLIEALLLGLIGSLIGVVLGVVISYLIRDVGETAFTITLNWRIYPEALWSGVFLGMVMTGLFGFLPTLVAGQVRPAVVLRPNEAAMPAAGLLQMLVTLVVMITILGLLVDTIVEGAIDYGPVYMIVGGGALVGLFAGIIVANSRLRKPLPGYFEFRLARQYEHLETRLIGVAGWLVGWLPLARWRELSRPERGRMAITAGLRAARQSVLLYGAAAIGVVLASVIMLIASEVWLPFGVGDVKPANDVYYAATGGDMLWVIVWALMVIVFGALIRWYGRALAGVLALSSLGVTFGGLLGWLGGLLLERMLSDTGVWHLLAEMSTGVVLVEGVLAVLGGVFVGYWLMIWAVGKLPSSMLLGLVSLVIVSLGAAIVGAAMMIGPGAVVVLMVVALLGWGVFRLRLWERLLSSQIAPGTSESGAQRPAANGQLGAAIELAQATSRGTSWLFFGLVLLSGGFLLVDVAGLWIVVLLMAVFALLMWRVLRRSYAIDGRLILREMGGRRGRVASTLLGLSVGIAGLALVSLTSGAVSQVLRLQIGESTEGNLLIIGSRADYGDAIGEKLAAHESVESFVQFTGYDGTLLEIDGETIEVRDFHTGRDEVDDPAENSTFERPEEGFRLAFSERWNIEGMPDYRMVEGRQLDADDVGTHRVMLRESFFQERYDIHAGARLLFLFENDPGEDDDVLLQLRVVGIISRNSEQTGLEDLGNVLSVPPGTLSGEGVIPENVVAVAQVDESDAEAIDRVKTSVTEVPGVIAFELGAITQLLENLIEQLRAIPTLVAWLALLAGTAIIANTVALATQERRRQIGVMKAVGLKGRRVLGMLMIENGLVGLIAGLIGVAVGFVATIVFVLASRSWDDLEQAVDFTTMGWLIIMSIGVAIGAATLSAWSAAAEKPMNVLRYE